MRPPHLAQSPRVYRQAWLVGTQCAEPFQGSKRNGQGGCATPRRVSGEPQPLAAAMPKVVGRDKDAQINYVHEQTIYQHTIEEELSSAALWHTNWG